MKRLIRWIKSLFRSSVAATKAVNTAVQQTTTVDTVKPEVKQDVPFFTRKNNLVQEFAYKPTPVYSSDLSSNEIVGHLGSGGEFIPLSKDDDFSTITKEYKGYMVTAFNKSELAYKIDMIDAGKADNLMGVITMEEYNKNKDGEQLLADDVEFLKDDPNYAKPNLEDDKTVDYPGIGGTQFKVQLGEKHWGKLKD